MKYCQECDYAHHSDAAEVCIKCGCSEFVTVSKQWRDANETTTRTQLAEQTSNDLLSWFGGIFTVAILVGGVYSVLSWCLREPTHRAPTVFGGQVAYSACVQFVTDSLETPATAIFPGRFASATRIEDLSDSGPKYVPHVYRVASYVDAQNKFGATIRTRFSCTASWSAKEGRWSLLSLNTSPWNEQQ